MSRFIYFEHGNYAYRMDTETGRTHQLINPATWREVKELVEPSYGTGIKGVPIPVADDEQT